MRDYKGKKGWKPLLRNTIIKCSGLNLVSEPPAADCTGPAQKGINDAAALSVSRQLVSSDIIGLNDVTQVKKWKFPAGTLEPLPLWVPDVLLSLKNFLMIFGGFNVKQSQQAEVSQTLKFILKERHHSIVPTRESETFLCGSTFEVR